MNWDPRAELLRKADALDKAQAGLPKRGTRVLAAVASHLRAAAAVYDTDPTLANCPTGRERDLDLAGELGRQTLRLVQSAAAGARSGRWTFEDRWAEAEALTERLPVILDRARSAARADHASPEGSRAISLLRLAAAEPAIRRLADELHAALASALVLPHPAPEAAQLAELADRITAHLDALEARR